MSQLQFLRTLIFPKALYKLQNSVKFSIFFCEVDYTMLTYTLENDVYCYS